MSIAATARKDKLTLQACDHFRMGFLAISG
jgi:hypothetical protein